VNYPIRPAIHHRLLDVVNEREALLAEIRDRLADLHRQAELFADAATSARTSFEECKARNGQRGRAEER
jgi:hypothetical protein